MKEKVIEWISGMYANAYNNMFLGNAISDAMGSGSGTASGIASSVYDICLSKVAPALSAIGMAIAVTFFLIALVELSTTERLTLEFFIKFFSKLVISVFIISICPELLKACISFGNSLINTINDIDLSAADLNQVDIYQKYYDYFMNQKDVSWILLVLQSMFNIVLVYILSLGLIIVVYIVSFTRVLEIGVRGALMPIALGLISDDGWKGAGGRYIRKFIAVCAQGAVITLIGKITNVAMVACTNVNVSVGSDASSIMGFLIMLGVAFASASLMFKSIGITNDVFGG